MKTLILGLGNTILSDDGVGVRVAETLQSLVNEEDVTVEDASLAGIDMLDLLAGYDKAIIIDAIRTVGGSVGQIYRLEPEAFAATQHTANLHDINFATALELGKRLGLPLPRQITIFAVEVADTTTFSEECTPGVKQAIPACVKMVVEELRGNQDA